MENQLIINKFNQVTSNYKKIDVPFLTGALKQQLIACCELEIYHFSNESIAYKNAIIIKDTIENNTFNQVSILKTLNLIEDYSKDFNNSTFFISRLQKLL